MSRPQDDNDDRELLLADQLSQECESQKKASSTRSETQTKVVWLEEDDCNPLRKRPSRTGERRKRGHDTARSGSVEPSCSSTSGGIEPSCSSACGHEAETETIQNFRLPYPRGTRSLGMSC